MTLGFDLEKSKINEVESHIALKDVCNDLIGNDGYDEGSGHLKEEDTQKPSRDDGDMLG